jgi:REP element-mobilizing transposase RayT
MKYQPVRKHPRLKGYDYSQNGAYYITFCVKNRHEMLGQIVECNGNDAHILLSEYGKTVKKYIEQIEPHYNGVVVDKYVIMTNHVHMIIVINESDNDNKMRKNNGASWSPRPTNALIPNIMQAIKKLTNIEFGFNMWQTSYYDHIIRNEASYKRIWQYIDENPAKWAEDCFYQIQG